MVIKEYQEYWALLRWHNTDYAVILCYTHAVPNTKGILEEELLEGGTFGRKKMKELLGRNSTNLCTK